MSRGRAFLDRSPPWIRQCLPRSFRPLHVNKQNYRLLLVIHIMLPDCAMSANFSQQWLETPLYQNPGYAPDDQITYSETDRSTPYNIGKNGFLMNSRGGSQEP